MKRFLHILIRLAIGLAVFAGLLFVAYRIGQGPGPEAILANLEIPPAPVLSAEEERSTFRTAPGFRVELVAAEPLVVDPVAMDWDEAGRLYVVEMRGFMGTVDGAGEDQPVGRVVVLWDRDGDGRMDDRHVFLDGLVLPRAIAVLPEGVLLGVPPDLLLCRDENADLRCAEEERTRLGSYADDAGNVEHRENALLPGLDGWIYNAKSSRRFRVRGATLEVEQTVFRGQWGIAQDDAGRLYYNHNSGFLYVDQFPAEYLMRQATSAGRLRKAGINVDLAEGEKVWGVRVAPGLNRAYQAETLRRDGRQGGPTAISGVVIQRGDQFGDEFKGDAFVPESAGSALAHFSIEHDGLNVHATHHLYSDPDWKKREFLASTDERFRPVDVKVGPDGAIWMIDMYRGVIQHAHYVSDYLRDYVLKHDLEEPGATGRIWRIVREDRPIRYPPPPLETVEDQVKALDHPNGWVRDRAMRRLIYDEATPAIPALTDLTAFSAVGRAHALWTLEGLGQLDSATWFAAVQDRDAQVRSTALRVGESILPGNTKAFAAAALEGLRDSDPRVRLQAIHSLGALAPANRPIASLLSIAHGDNALERQAVLSSLADLEFETLQRELSSASPAPDDWIRVLATGALLAAQSRESRESRVADVTALLTLAKLHAKDGRGILLLEGIREAQDLPGHERVVLGGPHAVFEDQSDVALRDATQRIRRGFTWLGDPNPGGARALTSDESQRREEGERLFAATCGTCHGLDGRGLTGLAPPLAGSPWVRDADDWLIRILLQGLQGPIVVDGVEWNSAMPGHTHDPRFDDEGIAGLTTHLRRSWGHADQPIAPDTVAEIRRASAAHPAPWTEDELTALPVRHRLDRFTGRFRIPVVGIELRVRREGPQLSIGRTEGGRAPLVEIAEGLFSGEGMQFRVDPSAEGPIAEARVSFGEQTVTVTRVREAAPQD